MAPLLVLWYIWGDSICHEHPLSRSYMLPYAPTIAHFFVAIEANLQEFSAFRIWFRARAHTVLNCVTISFKSIRLDGLGLLFNGLRHEKGMTPYYVVVQMQRSGDGTRYHLYVWCLCLSSPGFQHDTRNHRSRTDRLIHMHRSWRRNYLTLPLTILISYQTCTWEPVVWQTEIRKPAEILKYYILPPSSYAPLGHATSFACRHVSFPFSMTFRKLLSSQQVT